MGFIPANFTIDAESNLHGNIEKHPPAVEGGWVF